jgi:hypothetical protein
MWDARQQRATPTSKEVMDRIHRAFQLWESASGEALQFEFGRWGKASYGA